MTAPAQSATTPSHGGTSSAASAGSALPCNTFLRGRLAFDGCRCVQHCQAGQTGQMIVGSLCHFDQQGAQDGEIRVQGAPLNAPFSTACAAIRIRSCQIPGLSFPRSASAARSALALRVHNPGTIAIG